MLLYFFRPRILIILARIKRMNYTGEKRKKKRVVEQGRGASEQGNVSRYAAHEL